MGNMHESAYFVREIGDTSVMSDVLCKRSDQLYIKCTQTIKLTAIGLCFPISEKVVVYLHIYETLTRKQLLAQTLDLDPNRLVLSRNYDLNSPVDIIKDKYYTLSVEVYGGPMQTYLETCDNTAQNLLVLEVTRDDPRKTLHLYKRSLGVSKRPSVSSTSISKSSDEQSNTREFSPKVRTPQTRQTLNFSAHSNHAPLDSTESPRNQDTQASTPKNSTKSQFSPQRKRLSTAEPRVFRWKEQVVKMNLITGILFKRKTLSTVCC